MNIDYARWTEEDQAIWRTRKIPAHRIFMRYKHHLKEAELMVKLTQCDLPAGPAKDVWLALQP